MSNQQNWQLVTDFNQINRPDVEVVWNGDEPVAFKVEEPKVVESLFTPEHLAATSKTMSEIRSQITRGSYFYADAMLKAREE